MPLAAKFFRLAQNSELLACYELSVRSRVRLQEDNECGSTCDGPLVETKKDARAGVHHIGRSQSLIVDSLDSIVFSVTDYRQVVAKQAR